MVIVKQKKKKSQVLVAHICNPSSQEAEMRGITTLGK
jgi:hypothetical protein